MNIIRFLMSMVLPAAAGYAFLVREQMLSRVETLLYSFLLGTGLLSFYLFGLTLLRVPFALVTIAPFFGAALAAGIFRIRLLPVVHRDIPSAPRERLTGWRAILSVLFSLLILSKVLYIAFLVLSGPALFDDAVSTWNFKAKELYYGYAAGPDNVNDSVFHGSMQHYPLHLPVLRAWIAFCLGRWDDSFVNLHSLLLFSCMLALVFAFLKKNADTVTALAGTWVLSAVPVLVYNAAAGYADMATGCYFLAAALMLNEWNSTGHPRFLVPAGLFAAVAAFTKLEGTAIVMPSLITAFLVAPTWSRMSGKGRLAAAAVFTASSALAALWLAGSGTLSAVISLSGAGDASIRFRQEGIEPLFSHLFVRRSHNLFWYGVLFALAFGWRRASLPHIRLLLVPSAAAFCAILFVYLFTPNVAWLLNNTAINRTLLIIMPILTVACGLLLAGKDPGGDHDQIHGH